MLPFTLQGSEGRLASVLQLYKHAGEQPVAHHNVATQGIIHLHPEMMLREARRLRNEVVCMIGEYHLTGSAQGLSSLSPVLLEAATTLLPPMKDYAPSVAFEGTRDVRVVDCARTLRVAAWLHRLDMSARGDGMASETLEALWHHQGPLLDLSLTPMMCNLTFKEVVDRILYENRRDAQSLLDDLRVHRAHIHEEKASGSASPTMSPTSDRIHWRTTLPVMMACSAMVQRLRWLLPWEPMTLLQRAPRLKPLIPLQWKAKPMPWRWMMRVLVHLQLAQSPLWTTIY